MGKEETVMLISPTHTSPNCKTKQERTRGERERDLAISAHERKFRTTAPLSKVKCRNQQRTSSSPNHFISSLWFSQSRST